MSSQPPQLLTVDRVCDTLKLGRTAVYRAIQTGALKSVLIGKSRRISLHALEEFIAQLEADDSGAH
ncbi:MAG: helix-turn-helix domain-containing protein [Chloroflexi bacterium]|nr:helix-turn-helix domain-containing protein [Chloroflexota bacterium]